MVPGSTDYSRNCVFAVALDYLFYLQSFNYLLVTSLTLLLKVKMWFNLFIFCATVAATLEGYNVCWLNTSRVQTTDIWYQPVLQCLLWEQAMADLKGHQTKEQQVWLLYDLSPKKKQCQQQIKNRQSWKLLVGDMEEEMENPEKHKEASHLLYCTGWREREEKHEVRF